MYTHWEELLGSWIEVIGGQYNGMVDNRWGKSASKRACFYKPVLWGVHQAQYTLGSLKHAY